MSLCHQAAGSWAPFMAVNTEVSSGIPLNLGVNDPARKPA